MAKAKKATGAAKGKPRRATGRATPEAHSPAPGEGTVCVRMYKLQLGDCHLITFPTDDGREFHMLIDCGLIQGAADPGAVMAKVAGDIKERTGGVLDLVLITHEHWDHLSGFAQAREVFQEIEFRQLWVAWTEDPSDALAAKLRAEREGRRRALDAALDGFAQHEAIAEAPPFKIASALRAFSPALGAAGGGGVGEAFDWVKAHAGKANTRYCRPGDLLRLPGVSGARVYVLGPPHDEDLIRRSTPSGSHPETYLAEAEQQIRTALGSAAAIGGVPVPDTPFDATCGTGREQAEKLPLFRRYLDPAGETWRRIDADWIGPIGPLALQLDSDTNNTSLAVAIELLPSRKVLLFPGDAQVGNWLSWQGLKAWAAPGPGGEEVEAVVNDLFARTVLYKVGHHGSHNATLREEGLERMTGGDLSALVPVVPDFAATTKHWKMPWPDLLKRLLERTSRRVLDATTREAAGVEVTDLYLEVPIANGRTGPASRRPGPP